MKIVASAPGKIVVSGEYAVLIGAPALVVAIDRRVSCTLRDARTGGWTFHSHGFAADARHSLPEISGGPDMRRDDPAYLCQHALHQIQRAGIAIGSLPEHLDLAIDSRAGYEHGDKFGIGTSAAICAASTGALLARIGRSHDVFPIALAAHRSAQGGRGSGLDVAASCTGGLIRFEAVLPPRITRIAFPAIAFAAIWSGSSADTVEHVAAFDRWRNGTIPEPLQALATAASRVSDATPRVADASSRVAAPDPAQFMRQLRAYTSALQSLDEAAHLGIFSPAHRRLTDLASDHGVVYKPCGAGGGDLGMAFAIEAHALESFERAALISGFRRLPLELDEHGITVGIEG